MNGGGSYLHADHRPSAAAVLALVHRLVAGAEGVEAQDTTHAVPDQTHLGTRTSCCLPPLHLGAPLTLPLPQLHLGAPLTLPLPPLHLGAPLTLPFTPTAFWGPL